MARLAEWAELWSEDEAQTADLFERDLFGPPYQVQHFEKMERDVWSWHMRRFGDPGIPVALSVQMSMDGVVREVYIIDESHPGSGFGVFGGGGGVGVGIGF